VRLVDDHQVEMPDAEAALAVPATSCAPGTPRALQRYLVDQSHHRRIGSDEHPPFSVAVADQVHR